MEKLNYQLMLVSNNIPKIEHDWRTSMKIRGYMSMDIEEALEKTTDKAAAEQYLKLHKQRYDMYSFNSQWVCK